MPEVVGHGPAHRAAGVEVEHEGEIEPALRRRDVGQVGQPDPVWRLRREVALEQVGRDREGMPAVRRPTEPAPASRRQAHAAHQPCHPLAADPAAEANDEGREMKKTDVTLRSMHW